MKNKEILEILYGLLTGVLVFIGGSFIYLIDNLK